MITIDLYQPGSVDEKIDFPSEWNDFTPEQLHLVAKTILTNFTTPEEAQAAMFRSLLKICTGKKVKNIEDRLDAEDAVINGLPAIQFIYKENNLTRQPYPTLKVPLRSLSTFNFQLSTFNGPESDFNSLTCGEFEDAEICYNQFIMEPDQEKLAQLAAILYRHKNVKYLSRKSNGEYEPYDAEKMVPRFKKIKPWQLYTIFLWYAGCRNQLPKIFPSCFSGGSAPAENAEPDFLIFTKCIHAGAGPKNGSRNDIRCTLLKEFFLEIELQNIENEKLQNEINNAK